MSVLLKNNRLRAIKALMTEPSVKKAAKAAGISEATLHRWLGEPEFSAALRRARGQLLEGVLTVLQGAAEEAVTVLREIMNEKLSPPPARVRAARSVLDLTLKARSELETEERLRTIEAQLKQILERKGGIQ